MATELNLRRIFRATFANPLLNADYSCRVPSPSGWRDYIAFVPCRGDSARGRFTGPVSGIVRPLLDWSVERVE